MKGKISSIFKNNDTIEVKTRKLSHAVIQTIENTTGYKVNLEENCRGIILFIFAEEKYAAISVGEIDTLQIMEYLAGKDSNIMRIAGKFPRHIDTKTKYMA